MSEQKLKGRRILLVEDEFFQAMDAKSWLEEAGAEVIGPTGFTEDVPALLRRRAIDAAVLDINLGQGADFTVAHALMRKGVPFLFLTGYDCASLPEELTQVLCLNKPADDRMMVEAVEGLVAATA